MPDLARSSEIFAGALIFVSVLATGTSDATTKPISSSNLWLELAAVESLKPKAIKYSEEVVVPFAGGWEQQKREYTLADSYEVVTRRTTSLYQQLQFGLGSAIVAGTAQTPYVNADRKVLAWVKVQLRQHIGTDNFVLDNWCEIRVMGDPPAAEKATQKPNLEFFVLKGTTLNAVNFPA